MADRKIYIPRAAFTSLRHFLVKIDRQRPPSPKELTALRRARNFDGTGKTLASVSPIQLPTCDPRAGGEREERERTYRFLARRIDAMERKKRSSDSTDVISRFRRPSDRPASAVTGASKIFPGKLLGSAAPSGYGRRKISRYRAANNIPDIPRFRSHVADTMP